jgi:hypothetical protein
MGDDLMPDVSHDLRMNGQLDDLMTDGNRVNHNCVRRDLSLDVTMGVNLCRRKNDRLGDQKMVATKDVNHGHRLSDLLGDQKMVATKDVNHRDVLVGHCKYALDDQNLDASRENRNYVRRDLKMVLMKCHRVDLSIDPECYVMSHRVMLMVCLSKSCDQMSRDHLRYDHQMMRHRDMNRMDGMNLDAKNRDAKTNLKIYPMRLHHESRLMTVWMMRI